VVSSSSAAVCAGEIGGRNGGRASEIASEGRATTLSRPSRPADARASSMPTTSAFMALAEPSITTSGLSNTPEFIAPTSAAI
jgi:hypothetical protein